MKLRKIAMLLALSWIVQTGNAEGQVYIDFDEDVQSEQVPVDTTGMYVQDLMMPDYVYKMPLVFTGVQPLDTVSPFTVTISDDPSMIWVDKEMYKIRNVRKMRQRIFIDHPEYVHYNINNLPEPPKKFVAIVDPNNAILVVEDVETTIDEEHQAIEVEQKRYNWLNNFDGNIQFSQAYNSPNWYQGGNSHLNLLINANYNLKLNPIFYPNLLFDLNVQYKLAVNSTPDDQYRKYNISEELFQINSKFGVRASKSWFYTLTLQAKTQFLNNYQTNTTKMTASFLSPGDLNVGIGMTYNYQNPKKTLTFSASISPLSWNLKTCLNKRMNPADYDIEPGRKVANQIGSSGEATLNWKIAYNIVLTSRLFVFTDYSYLQGDLENTIKFSINRFLSTMLYVHLRYDSSSPRMEDTRWHTWQLREVLSFGFSYTFATS